VHSWRYLAVSSGAGRAGNDDFGRRRVDDHDFTAHFAVVIILLSNHAQLGGPAASTIGFSMWCTSFQQISSAPAPDQAFCSILRWRHRPFILSNYYCLRTDHIAGKYSTDGQFSEIHSKLSLLLPEGWQSTVSSIDTFQPFPGLIQSQCLHTLAKCCRKS
jgi:hypothetical protein